MPLDETLRTPLTELLRIKTPVILAGMGMPNTNPVLAAEVSNAGGLGVLGGAGFTPARLREEIRRTKELLVDKTAFGVDLLFPQVGGSARKTNHDYTRGQAAELIDIIIDEKARLFVSAVGVPPKWAVDRLHASGILCMNMVGLPSHVEKACAVGMDIVCATGTEAGGHVGEVATMVLVPQIVDAARGRTSPLHGGPVHVVAAGGIHDGRTLAAALMLGAQAAWVGTRFLASNESTPVQSRRMKETILRAGPTDTMRTLIWSGRPNRGYKIDYVKSWEHDPTRRALLEQLCAKGVIPYYHDVRAARDEGKKFAFARNNRLTMGQCSAAITSIRPAKEILETMVGDAVRMLRGGGSLIARL